LRCRPLLLLLLKKTMKTAMPAMIPGPNQLLVETQGIAPIPFYLLCTRFRFWRHPSLAQLKDTQPLRLVSL
jgi:hypothetical protein